jgi:endonuclease-3
MNQGKYLSRNTLASCIKRVLNEIYPDIKSALNYEKPHEFIFAVIMSAQTTDKQVNKVTKYLFSKYRALGDFANADYQQLCSDMSSVGLYKTKAKNIIATAKIICEKYKGKIPKSIDKLVELPGVGRKTANVVLSELYGINEGIAVDTHVIRLSQKYGLSEHTDPINIEKDLMMLIPRREWGHFTLRLIQYGRDYCKANCKKCPKCPLWKCTKSITNDQ